MDLTPTEASKAQFTVMLKERWKCTVHDGSCYKPLGGECIQLNATSLVMWSSALASHPTKFLHILSDILY
jgi:hypothetical protein